MKGITFIVFIAKNKIAFVFFNANVRRVGLLLFLQKNAALNNDGNFYYAMLLAFDGIWRGFYLRELQERNLRWKKVAVNEDVNRTNYCFSSMSKPVG